MTDMCIKCGLAEGDVSELNDLADTLESIMPEELLYSFIRQEKYWSRITEQDESFMRNDLAVVFGKSGGDDEEDSDIDVPFLMTPVRVYFELVEGKHPGVKSWPVIKEDIDRMWLTIKKLVRFAYKHISAVGVDKILKAVNDKKPVDKQVKELNISKYEAWLAEFEASFAK